jgi:hypothetical protein
MSTLTVLISYYLQVSQKVSLYMSYQVWGIFNYFQKKKKFLSLISLEKPFTYILRNSEVKSRSNEWQTHFNWTDTKEAL